MDSSNLLVDAALPVLALISAWGLAVWTAASRHRGWDSLKSDLELAEKLQGKFPEHAEWLERWVAVRLKGRALSDSRKRRDFRLAAYGLVLGPLAGFLYLYASIRTFATDEVALAILYLVPALFFFLVGGVIVFWGLKSEYRIPGISDLFMAGSNKTRDGLRNQLEDLQGDAAKLPDNRQPLAARDKQ